MSYRDASEPEVGGRRWLLELKRAGRLPLVEVATAAARCALAVWEDAHPEVSEPRETVEALERWLEKPTVEGARAIVPLTYRRGDPDDIDGCWFALDDGTLPSHAAMEAYFAADYAGNTVYATLDFAVDGAAAAIGCAKRAGVDARSLSRALRAAASAVHPVAYDDPGSLVAPSPREGTSPRIGEPDRSLPSAPCPACGGVGYPVGPKETTEGGVHVPHRCDACGRDFHLSR